MALAGTGAELNHLTPRPTKTLFADNYIAADGFDFTTQFLPEVYDQEIERFGKRTISGFLSMVGAEMPMASDRIIWSEQGRLHIAYEGVTVDADGDALTLPSNHLVVAGMTLVVSNQAGTTVHKAYVTSVSGTTVNIEVYDTADANLSGGFDSVSTAKCFVYGSEYSKGAASVGGTSDAAFTRFVNKPIIIRDKYRVSGSDVAQIGWVEVATEMGTSGYLWYLKSEHESRLRFMDYLEMSMVEAEEATTTMTQADAFGLGGTKSITGSEGLFAAIESRGIVYNAPDFDGAGGLGQFDDILGELDKQGAIEENMLFLDRATSLSIDNMLAAQNSYGAGGTSYGVFNNEEEMALNLGFTGFRRGSYDFYKTDWKYLNDATTRGLVGDIEGVLVPAGTSSVYDETLGQNISRPFLHVRYRANEAEDRRMKSWITGSVGGNFTSDADEMNVHYLSERALCVQAANNFVLLKK
jgi:hypothetical protein